MLVALRVHEHIAHVFTCTVCHSNSSSSNTRKSTPRNLPLLYIRGMLFLLMCTCGACGARCGCIDHADRVHAGKAAKSWCLQTERAPGSVSSICNHFITGAAHGHSSSRERLHFPGQPACLLLASQRISFGSCSTAIEVFKLVTAPCTADAHGELGGRRTLPVAAHMLPSAGPRGAHTARSDRPCGTTTDGPEPAPTRRSAVASAHPKPGYQRGQARACHFHAGYARPIYLLFRRPHCCQMTIPMCLQHFGAGLVYFELME